MKQGRLNAENESEEEVEVVEGAGRLAVGSHGQELNPQRRKRQKSGAGNGSAASTAEPPSMMPKRESSPAASRAPSNASKSVKAESTPGLKEGAEKLANDGELKHVCDKLGFVPACFVGFSPQRAWVDSAIGNQVFSATCLFYATDATVSK